MERLIDGERRLRREYSAAYKASVLAQTREPGASVAGVALSHGLHPNMVHRWLREQRLPARRLHQGKFVWAAPGSPNVALEHAQLNALVLGLPWQRVGSQGAITVI